MTIRYIPADNLFEWYINDQRMLKSYESSRRILRSLGYTPNRARLALCIAILACGEPIGIS
ncbi:MAG TPA: hypothetical protein PKC18_00445 [Lacipirellulaceae bacterium]|nr:hypothetical protein [Lacipirellulaceae bacterium]HMP07769.1 hypothetical protein [Lacipirellulaceae bacterium]